MLQQVGTLTVMYLNLGLVITVIHICKKREGTVNVYLWVFVVGIYKVYREIT